MTNVPNFYAIYVPRPSSGNYQIGKNNNIWGFTNARGGNEPIVKGDIIIFMFNISLETNPATGTANARQFFQGTVEEMMICEATSDLYYDDIKKVWPLKKLNNGTDNYPYRFDFRVLASKSHYVVSDYTTPASIQEAMRQCCCRQGYDIKIQSKLTLKQRTGLQHLLDEKNTLHSVFLVENDQPALVIKQSKENALEVLERLVEAETRHDIEIINNSDVPDKEYLTKARQGQGVFRQSVLALYPACPVTGISFPALLKASHIKAWSLCESRGEKLDPYNGIMLASHIDSLFDRYLISFNEDGKIIISDHPEVSSIAKAWGLENVQITIHEQSKKYLKFHQERFHIINKELSQDHKSVGQAKILRGATLVRSQNIQRNAEAIGFVWNDIEQSKKKVEEEIQELMEALQTNNMDHIKEELGDTLFALVNIACRLNFDADEALNLTIDKFSKRLGYVEKKMALSEDRALEHLLNLWKEAKSKA